VNRFDEGWAHAPSTRYSMPAILTGRLPLDVYYDTSVEGWPGLSQKATTLAEVLTPLGYLSGAITNYWYFDRSRHMDQGFAEYDNENARLHNAVAGAGPEQTKGSSAREQTDKAIGFVQRHASQKWFLWVHYYDPHYGYEPHPGIPAFGSDQVAMYDGELAYTDQQIGRLFDSLRAQGLYDKTIVVVTGDHGEGFGEHGIKLHGYHLYAPQTKVPFLLRVAILLIMFVVAFLLMKDLGFTPEPAAGRGPATKRSPVFGAPHPGIAVSSPHIARCRQPLVLN